MAISTEADRYIFSRHTKNSVFLDIGQWVLHCLLGYKAEALGLGSGVGSSSDW